MEIVTVVGARPQFIKAAPVTTALRERGVAEFLVHTGQHYDERMSEVFFDELGIRPPDMNLAVGSGSHGAQTARMLEGIERVLVDRRPAGVLVYGDTNSTLAGALAAVKLRTPIAHVEAGLRSFNRAMPEEHNRVLTDHASDLLFCPTATAVNNLAREGISDGVFEVGDTMYDAVLRFREVAVSNGDALERHGIHADKFFLCTVHRPYNTDDPDRLIGIMRALEAAPAPVLMPLHPRTRARLLDAGYSIDTGNGSLRLIEPLGYLEMLTLTERAALVLTDSGGLQKEAYFLGTPCLTLRPETEWVETTAGGWNQVIGADPRRIAESLARPPEPNGERSAFGDGHAAERIVEILTARLG